MSLEGLESSDATISRPDDVEGDLPLLPGERVPEELRERRNRPRKVHPRLPRVVQPSSGETPEDHPIKYAGFSRTSM